MMMRRNNDLDYDTTTTHTHTTTTTALFSRSDVFSWHVILSTVLQSFSLLGPTPRDNVTLNIKIELLIIR
jgi:hypothetical protein